MSNRPSARIPAIHRSWEKPEWVIHRCLFVLVLFLAAVLPARAQNINNSLIFPDSAFRRYVEEYMGVPHDGEFTRHDTEQKTEPFLCPDRGIKNLKGIEYFPNITALDCTGNGISSLNVSQNREIRKLNCRANNLTSLNVANLSRLEELTVADNDLTELDVRNNPLLTTLDCLGNGLTRLDLSQNPLLKHVDCSSNLLAELNVTPCLALETLICSKNRLPSLNLENNRLLRMVFCQENQLRSLILPPRG
nr:hypothetical protein [bacterium]